MSAWLEAEFAQQRPQAIAALTRQFRDLDLAEDAFADACVKALATWERAPPRDPYAWLLHAARNIGIDRLRKARRHQRLLETKVWPATELEDSTADRTCDSGLRDDVLRLLFICCHPALSRQDQLALALKIVVGMSVEEIARAFLVRPKAMEQRITRAKRTVADNPVSFETPSLQDRAKRLDEVTLMVYLLFNEGWSSSARESQLRLPLCEEAIRLARLLLQLFPGMSQQMSLLSLLLFLQSRRRARIASDGRLMALDEQDRNLWDRGDINEALTLLQKAERHGGDDPYRIQAAIAAQHAIARSASTTDWQQIEAFYEALYCLQPTPVVRLNQIATLARTRGANHALGLLAELDQPLAGYRWLHTLRGALLIEIQDFTGAIRAYETALGLDPTALERVAIREKITIAQKMSDRLSDRHLDTRP